MSDFDTEKFSPEVIEAVEHAEMHFAQTLDLCANPADKTAARQGIRLAIAAAVRYALDTPEVPGVPNEEEGFQQ